MLEEGIQEVTVKAKHQAKLTQPFKVPSVNEVDAELSSHSFQFVSSDEEVLPQVLDDNSALYQQNKAHTLIQLSNKRIKEREQRNVENKLDKESLNEYVRELNEQIEQKKKKAENSRNSVCQIIQLTEYIDRVVNRGQRIPIEAIKGMKKFVSVGILSKIEEKERKLESQKKKRKEMEERKKKLEQDLKDFQQKQQEMQRRITKQQKKARFFYNELTDMNGRIRIYARMRPRLKAEKTRGDELARIDVDHQKAVMKVSNEPIGIETEEESKTKTVGWQVFQYNGVYGGASTQVEVFEEVKDMIVSAVYGESVTIFAYGQTGSGKTFTMEGGDSIDNLKERGIIPRAFTTIFEVVSRDTHYEYELEASIQEIYLKEVRDLVNPENVMKQTDAKSYKYKPERVAVKSKEDIQAVLNKMKENRKVASTSCNQRSSRSHSIFQLFIASRERGNQINVNESEKKSTREGTLNLIDLAGSERVQQSKVVGVQLKQAMAINSSLMALGQVIEGLVKQDDHVPFKNSMLTVMLQKYLSQRGKIAMFVNISPLFSHLKQTLSTLKFGSKAGQAQLKKAKQVPEKDTVSEIDSSPSINI